MNENISNIIPDSFFDAFDRARGLIESNDADSPIVKRMHQMQGQKEVKENYNLSNLTPFVLTEALFEDAPVQEPASVRINDKEISLADIQDPQVFNMIKDPCFGSGWPKLETWILIKLYEGTINPGDRYTDIIDGKKCISRLELLRRVGTAREAASQTSTYFNAYKVLGLAYLKNNNVYPGPMLEDWLLGKANVEVLTSPDDPKYDTHMKKYKNWPNRFDLSKFFGYPDFDKKTPCATKRTKADEIEDAGGKVSKESSPLDAFPDLDVAKESSVFDSTVAPAKASTSADRKKKAKVMSADFFEELDPNDERDDVACARRFDNSKMKEYHDAYREFEGLAEDFEISAENLNEAAFDHLCNMNGWNRDYAYELMTGRK